MSIQANTAVATSQANTAVATSGDLAVSRFAIALRVLAAMILTLMALGAGVRAMNAGLSCPDWPLCFGKVIPDFHPAVWFEFVHRAYAGLVSIVFIASATYAWRSALVPLAAKRASLVALFFLMCQIVMGGLTVLLLVKYIVVTTHLMLATLFFSSILWMSFLVRPDVEQPQLAMSVDHSPAATAGLSRAVLDAVSVLRMLRWVALTMVILVLAQIFLGGLVASTYAGSVCVDWPLCNGQWVPTWQGAIGLQIIHRMTAYAIAIFGLALAVFAYRARHAAWMTPQLQRLSRWGAVAIVFQVVLGIVNLVLYIPPHLTVLHQSGAIVVLGLALRFLFIARRLGLKTT